METSAVPALLIGALFVEKGLVTQEQLDQALQEQETTGNRLGEILVDRFGVSRLDLAGALAEQWAEYERQGGGSAASPPARPEAPTPAISAEPSVEQTKAADNDLGGKRPIGEFFVERGLITTADLEGALEEQRSTGQRLGEILVARGNLSRLELASALADQWATFQKLRPPAPSDAAGNAEPAAEPVMPTPEATRPAVDVSGASRDVVASADVAALRQRMDQLGAQLDQLTAGDWRQSLESTTAAHDARLGAVEQVVSERLGEDAPMRDELSALLARVDQLAATFAAVPDPLSVDLPAQMDELNAAIHQLETKLEELAASQAAGKERSSRKELAVLESRLDELAAGAARNLDDVRSALDSLVTRVEELAPADEWRGAFESLADELRSRLMTIEQTAPAAGERIDGLRAELTELQARFTELPVPSDEWRGAVEALAARLDGIPTPSDEWRDEVAELRARIAELPLPSDEWRGAVEALAGRLDVLAATGPELEELKVELSTLAARLDAFPLPSDEWRVELGQVAENLRSRFERAEADLAARAERGAVEELSSRLSDLAEQLPAGFGELHDLVGALSRKVDSLPPPLPAEELRGEIAGLAARIDALPLPDDEWRVELGGVAQNLTARFDRVEADLTTRAAAAAVSELQTQVHDLRLRIDELPDEHDDWREPLHALGERVDELPDNLAARLDRIDGALTRCADHTAVADLDLRVDELSGTLGGRWSELQGALAELSQRVDAIPPPGDEVRHELAQVADNLRIRLERVETGLEQRPGFDLIAGLRDELADVSHRIDERLLAHEERSAGHDYRLDHLAERIATTEGVEERVRGDLRPLVDDALEPVWSQVNGLSEQLEQCEQGLDGRLRRLEELRTEGPSAADVAAALGARIDAADALAADALASFDDRLSGLGTSLDASLADSHRAIDGLRHELGDVRAVTMAAAAASSSQISELGETLRGELATAIASSDRREQVERLESAVSEQGRSITSLHDAVRRQESRLEKGIAKRSGDVAALSSRLAELESSFAGALTGWRSSIDQSAESMARLAEVDTDLTARLADLEKAQAKRSDVKELREALARVEDRLVTEAAQDETRVHAVEEALRDGLAALGARLAESEGAYFQAGDALRRSIVQLGSAIHAADRELAPSLADAPAPVVATSFLAFAPTPDGYRLIELDGAPPSFGDSVAVPDCTLPLVVSRIGSSPLPFDRRACAYLEVSA